MHNHTCFSWRMEFERFPRRPGESGWAQSENTWSGHLLFSDGKICFLIQSLLLPPGFATPRHIPAVWDSKTWQSLKNSLITIPENTHTMQSPNNGGNANCVSRWLREAWRWRKIRRFWRPFWKWGGGSPPLMIHIHEMWKFWYKGLLFFLLTGADLPFWPEEKFHKNQT